MAFPANVALYLLYNRARNSTRPSTRSVHVAISLLTFATVVFRSELLMLLGPLVLQALLSGSTTFKNVIKVGLISGIASVGLWYRRICHCTFTLIYSTALTVSVDSYFWQRYPLWPELYGVYFNVVQGKSSDWGVSVFSPFVWYRSNHHGVFTGLAVPRIFHSTPSQAADVFYSTLCRRCSVRPSDSLAFVACFAVHPPAQWAGTQRVALHRVCRAHIQHSCG